jgi:hypothetical protein
VLEIWVVWRGRAFRQAQGRLAREMPTAGETVDESLPRLRGRLLT